MKRKSWRYGFLVCGLFSTLFSQETTPIRPISELGAQDLQLTSHHLAEYPDICQDQKGNVWVVYSELNENRERIVLKKVVNFTVVDSMIVNHLDGLESFPRLTCDQKNRLWITWCAKRENNWDIYARILTDGKWSDEMRVSDDPKPDLHPVIRITSENDIWIAWESLRNGNFDIVAARILRDRPQKPVLISDAPEPDLRPEMVSSAKGGLMVLWDRQKDDDYHVMMNSLTKKSWSGEIMISSGEGFNLAPSAADNQGTLMVAWQTNLRPDGMRDYNHWLLLRQIKQNEPGAYIIIEEPGDRLKIREDQSLEFSTVLYDHNNRLWIFSRASQDFYAQCFQDGKKSPLYRFDITGWGGRGVNIRAIRGNDGYLYSVRRDLKYIYLNRLDTEKANLTYDSEWQVVESYPIQKSEQLPIPAAPEQYAGEIKLPDSLHFYFGDIHQHSALSDGVGTADECFTRSAAIFHYDFAALTDHEWFTSNQVLPSEWEWIKMVCQQVTIPGKFIAIPAYEWTSARLPGGFGHKNVYFPNFDAPVFSLRSDAKTPADLFRLIEPFGAIAIPHHIGWTGTDWESFDSGLQPVSEIVSTHGAFEYMGNEPIMHRGGLPGNFVRDGLLMGKKFGLVGGSDGHGLKWHHGVGYKESEFESGLTVVIAPENSLSAIFEAFRARRVYATSGSRIFIDFRINGEWMGSDLTAFQQPVVALRVMGSASLHKVEVIRDGEIILALGKDTTFGRGVNRTFTDSEVQSGQHFYYLRVIQENGEMAWSSPIWVNLNRE